METYSLFLLSITAAVSIQTLKSRRENCAAGFRLKHDLIALVAHLPHRTSCKYTSDIWQAQSVSLAANDSIWPHGHLVLSASARVSCKGQRANLKRRSWFTCATLRGRTWCHQSAECDLQRPLCSRRSRETTAVAHQSLHGSCWEGFFCAFFFYQRRTCTGRQIDREGGAQLRCRRQATLCVTLFSREGDHHLSLSLTRNVSPTWRREQSKKKKALCFLFNHTLLDVITPFLCLMTQAVWTEARYSSSQTPDCACRSEASWRRWGGSSWCGRGGEKAGRARNSLFGLAWPATLWGTVFYSLPTRIADQPITWQQLNALRHVEAVRTTCLLSVSLAVCLSSEHQNENGEERRLKWIQTWSMWLFERSSPVLTESGPGRGE